MNNQMNCVICENQTHDFVICVTDDGISQHAHGFVIKFIDFFHFIFVFQCWLVEIVEQIEYENHNYKLCEQCQFISF